MHKFKGGMRLKLDRIDAYYYDVERELTRIYLSNGHILFIKESLEEIDKHLNPIKEQSSSGCEKKYIR